VLGGSVAIQRMRPRWHTGQRSSGGASAVDSAIWPVPPGLDHLLLGSGASLRASANPVRAPSGELARSGVSSARRKRLTANSDPAPNQPPREDSPAARAHGLSWAKLLRRVLEIEPLASPTCPVRLRTLSFITDHTVVDHIFAHLGRTRPGLPPLPAAVPHQPRPTPPSVVPTPTGSSTHRIYRLMSDLPRSPRPHLPARLTARLAHRPQWCSLALTRPSRNQKVHVTLRHASTPCASRASGDGRKFLCSAVQDFTRK
jgi:hypothetical protein